MKLHSSSSHNTEKLPPAQLRSFSFYHSDRHLNHVSENRPTQVDRQPPRAKKPFRFLFALALLSTLIIVAILVLPAAKKQNNQVATSPPKNHQSQPITPPVAKAPSYSLSDPSSIWVVVNKQRPLQPKTYAPAHLVIPDIPMRPSITYDEEHVSAVMAPALEQMVNAASAQGINLNLQSGYRSYSFQVSLYNRYVSEQGQIVADEQSARPGYSEHQTGLAADLGSPDTPACEVAQCFGNTPAGEWLAANADKYGFIVRYPEGEQQITGYEYEPWHVRYVGTYLSTQMHNKGITTLESYFHLPAAPNYN